jgi:hypothetical protein
MTYAISAVRRSAFLVFAILLAALSACDWNSSSSQSSIAGTVSGLAPNGTLVIADGTSKVSVHTNGSFSLSIGSATSYKITVATQPTGQTCTVSNGQGSTANSYVSDVSVLCANDTYEIGGTASGLPAGQQVILKNSGTDALTLSANGAFVFTTPVHFDGSYLVTVGTQPSQATCSVTNGSGAGVTAAISNANVVCSADTYTVGGTVNGLASGTQVVLENNGADNLTVGANGQFSFTARVAAAGSYAVTVGTQPVGAVCSVTNAHGSQLSGNIANILVTCSPEIFTVGGTLSGLANGAQVTLDNNRADPVTLTSNGSFAFTTPIAYLGSYDVTVATQPNAEACTVTNGSGSQVATNITNVNVACSFNSVSFTLPGTYTWTVPAGVTSVQVVAAGGGGGGGGISGTHAGLAGGAGALVTSTLAVAAGQVFNIVVGAGGGAGATPPDGSCGAGGGGGGASSVDAGSTGQVIAGGGGGGGGGGCNAAPGGAGGGVNGAGGSGGATGGLSTGGSGGSGGIGGAGGSGMFGLRGGAAGGNGNGGAGGGGGQNGPYPGGAGGSGSGTGTGGNDINNDLAGGGGGGYGGGGSGTMGGTGGGAGGSGGPAGTIFVPGPNGGASATNGGDGSLVITNTG